MIIFYNEITLICNNAMRFYVSSLSPKGLLGLAKYVWGIYVRDNYENLVIR